MTGPSLDDEVTFLIGVDRVQQGRGDRCRHLERAHPAGLQRPSRTRRNGAARRPARAPPSATSSPRRRPGPMRRRPPGAGGMELWSAVANITFTEAASDSAANFKIVRGADGEAQATFVRHGSRSHRRRHDPDAGCHRLGRLDRHHSLDDLRPDRPDTRGEGRPSAVDGGPRARPHHRHRPRRAVQWRRQSAGPAVQRIRHDAVDADVVHQAGNHGNQVLQQLPRQGNQLGPDGRSQRRRRFSLQQRAVDADDAGHPGGPASLRRGHQRAADGRWPHLRLQLEHRGLHRPLLRLQRLNKNAIVTLWENGRNNTLDLSDFSQDAIDGPDPRHLLERRRPRQQSRHRLQHRHRKGHRRQRQRHHQRIECRFDAGGPRRQRSSCIGGTGDDTIRGGAQVRTRSTRATASIRCATRSRT